MWAALLPLVLWLAVIAACVYEDGMNLFQWMGCFSRALERPFSVRWTAHTLKFMMGSVFLYGCGIALYYSGRENRRPGEEYGSAKWGDPKELNRKYMNHQHKEANIILTQHVRLGMDGYITQRNMNILVVGGSGSGKTRFFCKPGVYSANCSYLITDPKGELLRASGGLLKNKGYDVKVFNLIDPSQSDCYNPFVYVHNEKDVLTLIDNLIKNTTPRNASSNDPFWEKAEIALDSALMLYLISEAPSEERNFETMLYMMNFAEVREDDDQYRSPLDMLFRALEEEQPNHVAVKQYKVFKQAAGVVCSKRLLNQAVGKSLRTHNLKPKKGAQVMRKNEKITALYERLSRDDFGKDDDQQRESNSISNQKAMLEEFAARQGFTNIVHFTDDGISGTCFDRPGFLAMMKEVEAGNVEYLCIKDMSRMGRDYLKVGQIMEILRQRGVRLIAINDGVDSARGDDDFTPFRNIMNEYYGARI